MPALNVESPLRADRGRSPAVAVRPGPGRARRADTTRRVVLVALVAVAALLAALAQQPGGGPAPLGPVQPQSVVDTLPGPSFGTVLAAGSAWTGEAGPVTATAEGAGAAAPGGATNAAPGSAAAIAIRFALAQVGLPYVWGGNGPAAGDAGFDCSGLTTAAYAAAGIALPRTAHTQYYRGPLVVPGTPLLPGDLVFYGVPTRVHHVAMYLGAGRIVNAPRRGQPVQVAPMRWGGDGYLGATRPAAGGAGGVPPDFAVDLAPRPVPPPLVSLLFATPPLTPPPTVVGLDAPIVEGPPVLAPVPEVVVNPLVGAPEPPPALPVAPVTPGAEGAPPASTSTPSGSVTTTWPAAGPTPPPGSTPGATPIALTPTTSPGPTPTVTPGPTSTPHPTAPSSAAPPPSAPSPSAPPPSEPPPSAPPPSEPPPSDPPPSDPPPSDPPPSEPEPVTAVRISASGESAPVRSSRAGSGASLVVALRADALAAWPASGDTVTVTYSDGTARRYTVVSSDAAEGVLVLAD